VQTHDSLYVEVPVSEHVTVAASATGNNCNTVQKKLDFILS